MSQSLVLVGGVTYRLKVSANLLWKRCHLLQEHNDSAKVGHRLASPRALECDEPRN